MSVSVLSIGACERAFLSFDSVIMLLENKDGSAPENGMQAPEVGLSYHCTVSQADEGAVRIPKDRTSYFDISKVPIDGQMSNAFNDNICFI